MTRQTPARQASRAPADLTGRDCAILLDLWRFRYLTTEQVARLHFGHPKLAQRRLRRLVGLGLVGRFRAAEAARSGFRMWCHHLTRAATAVVANRVGMPEREVGHPTRPPRSLAFLQHHTLLTDFRIWLREGCVSSAGTFGYQFVPAYEETRSEGVRSRRVLLPVPGHARALVPDGVFSLDRRDGRRALFCLEVDRGTEPITGRHPSAIEHKLVTYRGAFEAHCERAYEALFRHQFRGFRVLFLVPDRPRGLAIIDLAGRTMLSPLVWVATHDLVRRGGRLADQCWQCEPDGPLHALQE